MITIGKIRKAFKIIINTMIGYRSPEITYYSQYSLKYFYKPYGQETIGTVGCGPFACAIVCSSLLQRSISPIEIAKWAYENGFYEYRHGSYHSLIPTYTQKMGLKCEDLGDRMDELDRKLNQQNTLAILLCKQKTFATGRHFIVVGKKGSKMKVYNSGNVLDCYRSFDQQKLKESLAEENIYIGPIWCISKE